MTDVDDACSVTVRSAGPLSRAAIAHHAATPLLGATIGAWRKRCAREFSLPDAEVTVATGHQAEVWHPGILAKFVWADAAVPARTLHAAHIAAQDATPTPHAVVHLLVDTDTRDPLAVHAPVTRDGALYVAHHVLGRSAPPESRQAAHVEAGASARATEGTVACGRSARVPSVLDLGGGEPALACVGTGLVALQAALAAHAEQPSAARQAWLALRSTLAQIPGLTETHAFDAVPWVCTSRLLACSLGHAIVERAAADPAACRRAFNLAAAQVPRSARPLTDLGDRGLELPFWALEPSGVRRRVGAHELPELLRAGGRLAPRGFLTSAMARIGLCDRFVHGTGGERYEQATEAFIQAWLGAPLPPFDTVTATVLLPFARDNSAPAVTHRERRAAWFDPDAAFGGSAEPRRALLAAVNSAPRRSLQRREAWRALHAHVQRARGAHAAALARLAERAAADASRAREAMIRADRTWPVPLYPPEAITRMAQMIRSQRAEHRQPTGRA